MTSCRVVGVVKVSGVERVERVEALLRDTTHNAFPVVDVPLSVKRRKVSMQRSLSQVPESEEAAAAADSTEWLVLFTWD